MTDNSNGGKQWTEIFRLITPFFLIVITYIGGNINTRLTDIDTKLFKHLTDNEIHSLRNLIVTKPEFLIYQEMRDKQMNDLKDLIIFNNKNLKERIDDVASLMQKQMEKNNARMSQRN